jgi:hypothetical protein
VETQTLPTVDRVILAVVSGGISRLLRGLSLVIDRT